MSNNIESFAAAIDLSGIKKAFREVEKTFLILSKSTGEAVKEFQAIAKKYK